MREADPLVLSEGAPAEALAASLMQAWAAGRAVGLAHPAEGSALAKAIGAGDALAPWQAAVVLGSGGSSGGRHWCVQPLDHLRASAAATATWLEQRGLDPAACLHLNPLPLHHVSGLLPLVRCRSWGAELRFLPPAWLRDPALLAAACPLPPGRPALVSLVPTQLGRLLASADGLAWLRGMAVIWVGGAALPQPAADLARRHDLRLSPCYGATETAAMVTALPPERFLAGQSGCGSALCDVELRLDPAGSSALQVRTARLCPGWLEDGHLRPLPRDGEGWWRSGDAARLAAGGLNLLGRLDGALQSGAETVFPEQVEAQLLAAAARDRLPLEAVLVLGVPDADLGERLVALVRPCVGADGPALIRALQAITAPWWPATRPRLWQLCPTLAPTATGKWQRARWRRWLEGEIGGGR
jgi:O-succinylbenzoic acid--CoA ligase